MNIWNLPTNEHETDRFLQLRGILTGTRTCRDGHAARFYETDGIVRLSDKRICRSKVNVHVGARLKNLNLIFVIDIGFLYNWAFQLSSDA